MHPRSDMRSDGSDSTRPLCPGSSPDQNRNGFSAVPSRMIVPHYGICWLRTLQCVPRAGSKAGSPDQARYKQPRGHSARQALPGPVPVRLNPRGMHTDLQHTTTLHRAASSSSSPFNFQQTPLPQRVELSTCCLSRVRIPMHAPPPVLYPEFCVIPLLSLLYMTGSLLCTPHINNCN